MLLRNILAENTLLSSNANNQLVGIRREEGVIGILVANKM